MNQIMDYVKPELLVIAIVLYFIGMWLKQAQTVKDKYIPLLLGGMGIIISAVYIFATCQCNSSQKIALAVFTAVTQGVLVAGLSTYVNQIINDVNTKIAETLHKYWISAIFSAKLKKGLEPSTPSLRVKCSTN